MEELFVYILLQCNEIIEEDEYSKKLDELFLENPKDDALLYLEWETDIKKAYTYIWSHIDFETVDEKRVGKILMNRLKIYYENCLDIRNFAKKTYCLWQDLPEDFAQKEPFFTLSYVDEPLSWGDEEQSRNICEHMFNYYKN